MTYTISFYAPGKTYAGITAGSRPGEGLTSDSAVDVLATALADDLWGGVAAAREPAAALVKLAPSEVTCQDGTRITIQEA